MTHRNTLLALVVVLASGCASTITPKLQAVLVNAPTGPVACADTCKTEWERAQLWITNHSKWKVQTATDVVISTYNPPNYDVSYGFTITREPLGEGKYRISMGLMCGNPLGCDPEPNEVRRAFYQYISTGNDALVGLGYLGSIR